MAKKKIESSEHKVAPLLGKVIKARRRNLNLTQNQLAEYAGCGVVFIYDLEIGKTSVRLDKLIDVLRVLGLEFHLQLGKTGLDVVEELIK